jgi:hypothetical protein
MPADLTTPNYGWALPDVGGAADDGRLKPWF